MENGLLNPFPLRLRLTHLAVITKQLEQKSKLAKIDIDDDLLPVGTTIEDSNCYGDHKLIFVD